MMQPHYLDYEGGADVWDEVKDLFVRDLFVRDLFVRDLFVRDALVRGPLAHASVEPVGGSRRGSLQVLVSR